MNYGKIGGQNVEFFEGHLFFFWWNKIGPAIKRLWSVKDGKGEKYFIANKVWNVIAPESFRKLFKSLPQQMAAIIELGEAKINDPLICN